MGFIIKKGLWDDTGFLNLNVASSQPGYTWTDSDGYAWYQNVVSNGGTITNSNQAKFDTAFQSLKSTNSSDGTSLWSHINQGYWFIGQESLTNGLFVPFYNTNTGSGLQPVTTSVATNYNFSTYTKKGGIVGDNSTTYIDTGINNNATTIWKSGSPYRHGYVYLTNPNNLSPSGNNLGYPFGVAAGSTSKIFDASFNVDVSGATLQGSWGSNGFSTGVILQTLLGGFASGGWGIITTNSLAGGNTDIAAGNNNYFAITGGTPQTTSLRSTNILIGTANIGSYSANNIICATFGKALKNNDFSLIDTIVNTLIASLT